MARKKEVLKKAEKEVKQVVVKVEKTVKKVAKKAEKAVEDLGEEVGKITHYFDNIGVAVVELAKDLVKGVKIRIKGATTDFEQLIESMQLEHKQVEKAKKGQAVGMKVKGRVRPNDKVYRK